MKRICVFCGSSAGNDPVFAEAARATGETLARHKLGLVYGGGNIGLMGLVADAVLAQSGEVIGVIPQALVDKELAHRGLTELRVVNSMHERKAMMAELADGFIALPGGYGTLEEFCEVLTWAQLGLHRKPCGLLNTSGFYDPLLAQIDHAVRNGFIREQHRACLVVDSRPAALLERLRLVHPPAIHKWIDRDQT
ncbi:MAG: TIGR00730 family Rossman fold protein [Verrucomicrobia bacterium]|nr:TIGR00730 family Rossman fold protein [Verrucomicrobiota bacterium]